jgi:hypothetical protein
MADSAAIYQFSLVKGNERYLVNCSEGDEEIAIAQLMEWAENPEMNFDWFDAAVLARQITQRVFGRATGQESPCPEPERN